MFRVAHRWKFSLLVINLTVVVMMLFQVVMGHLSGGRELLQGLTYSLVFANATGIPATAILPSFVERLMRRKLPLIPSLMAGFVGFTAIGCFFAQFILIAFRAASFQNFWHDYLYTLRFATLFAIVFGLGSFFYASMREQLRETEKKLHEKEIAEERTRKLQAEARLRWLESRIHPHFLFNTLNSISSLIPSDPVRAEQIVGRLSNLLRSALDSTNQPLIPLTQEMEIVENYLDIEKTRFGAKLCSVIDISYDVEDAKVPPLSVQSLVENAVKYGITPQKSTGEIVVRAFSRNGDLHIEVADSGPGFDLAAVPAGHGLDNLVGRLDALFSEHARLNVTRRDGHCVVEMSLPRS